MRPEVALIWAQTPAGLIGAGGALPWHLPQDLARFRALTWGSAVVMGHATWLSLPRRYRPLPGRLNLVLSRSPSLALDGAEVVGGPEAALAAAARWPGSLWVIGGASVFEAFWPLAARAEVTVVDLDVGGDRLAPRLDGRWRLDCRDPAEGWRASPTGLRYRFETWRRRQSQ
ncbi:MAG: dihydrofolate reductase [Bifidobacteriaceae bacterium]|jgi:dihydrofolate reductase|nr:dihydrofolate reductase [Bifidobacteriaceae bacterium]